MIKHSFDDLVTLKKFISFKQNFILEYAHDSLYNRFTREEINPDLLIVNDRQSAINQYNVSEEDINRTESNFNQAYLTPALPSMSENFYKDFLQEIDDKAIYMDKSLEIFKRKTLKKLEAVSETIETAVFLDSSFKEQIKDVIDDLFDKINKYEDDNNSEKIPLKLTKNEVLVLFHLLLLKGYIPQTMTKRNLSRLIEKNFEYYNYSEKIYKPITKAIKLEDEIFSNDGDKNPETTLEKLQLIFSNPDFYKLENRKGMKK